MSVYECTVQAILEGNKEAIYHAMMLDPLASAVCSLDEIRQMTDEMLEAERDYLPEFCQ
jgi:alpha-galactosidase